MWYRPPANFDQHMFYQMVHTATIMAVDIGIGKRQSSWRKRYLSTSRVRSTLPDPEGAESRRGETAGLGEIVANIFSLVDELFPMYNVSPPVLPVRPLTVAELP